MDGQAVVDRMRMLLATPAERVEATSVPELFALPPLPTLYDDPRTLGNAATLSGTVGWSVRIDGTELFFPLTGEPEFTGSPYAYRVHPRRRGEVRLSVSVLSPLMLASGRCFSARDFLRTVELAGWRYRWTPPALDSNTSLPAYTRGRRLNLSLSPVPMSGLAPTDEELGQACRWGFHLERQAS